MTEKTSIAYIKAIKSSPIKVARVTKNIPGLKVSNAIKLLSFSKLKVSSILSALIYSAISNAENNQNIDVDNLYVKKIEVGRSFSLRRFATRGRGKSTRILKTFSNVRVTLVERLSLPEKNKAKKGGLESGTKS